MTYSSCHQTWTSYRWLQLLSESKSSEVANKWTSICWWLWSLAFFM